MNLSELRAARLQPSDQELIDSARWARTQDPSEGFKGMLVAALEHLGVQDADQAI